MHFKSKPLKKIHYIFLVVLGGIAWGILIQLVLEMAFDAWEDTYWLLALIMGLALTAFLFIKDYAQYRGVELNVESNTFEIKRPGNRNLSLEKHKLHHVRTVKTYYGFVGRVKMIMYFKNPDSGARTHIILLIDKEELARFKHVVEGD